MHREVSTSPDCVPAGQTEPLLLLPMMTALLAPSYSSHLFALQPPPPRPRHAPLRLQEPPFPLPYEVPEQEKPFADYVWDPDRLQ